MENLNSYSTEQLFRSDYRISLCEICKLISISQVKPCTDTGDNIKVILQA